MHASNQAIAEFDAAILRNAQLTKMISQQIADNLIEQSCKVADEYDGNKLNDVAIEDAYVSIRHSLRKYWSPAPLQILLTSHFKRNPFFFYRKDQMTPQRPTPRQSVWKTFTVENRGTT